jgi:hypothetical protein
MTAISRFDLSIASLRRRGRQTSDPPEEADYEHTRAFFSPLVDRPPAVNVRAHDANDAAHVSRSRERADRGSGEGDRGMSPVAWR